MIKHTLLLLVLLLVACSSRGPINTPGFDKQFTGLINENEQILLFSACQLRADTYMEGEIKMVPTYQGVMVLTNKAVRFLLWDSENNNYKVGVEMPYRQLAQHKFEFNTLISSFVAVRTYDGHAYAFMLSDETIKPMSRYLTMGKMGHLQ